MIGTYVGYVSGDDRLHGFLSAIIHDQLGMRESRPAFRAFRLNGSNEVYGYEEKSSRARVICKFYGPKYGWDRDRAARTASDEFESLHRLRGYDLVGSPHHVIRPLGVDPETNGVLAVEYYEGEQFSTAIRRCTEYGDDAHLYWRLKALAFFLATQHNKTANGQEVDFGSDSRYLDGLVGRLRKRNKIGQWDADELLWLRDLWAERPRMWQDQQVWLHGDATPANFLFGHGLDVAAIDLERMGRGDRMFDVGRVAGELQHAFMSATGDARRAEPFIGHFLWEYSSHFPDRGAAFASITSRAPFYMGLNLLRISRNDYVGADYRRRLIRQAKRLLRAS
ncbi:phosphotransferase [Subtercola frigoramans]|uniref:Aminoglycoside phosphotransferase (APT) family kinase protein n=1 Tax=Subtercola frigoramans TaxID=120298 RepID=A0ABS2L159_9MICO|nr:phosphotransferase [Subtercola frigoramans]MBM7470812.1 aminoglycoside phosphotransferase (APT) family kinase protein [Subtercola frigoramans]